MLLLTWVHLGLRQMDFHHHTRRVLESGLEELLGAKNISFAILRECTAFRNPNILNFTAPADSRASYAAMIYHSSGGYVFVRDDQH
jgi:hypothetical protein